jgi:hypothetical protein
VRTERLAVAALLALAVVLWAVVPTFPNYDATYHLVWGRELLDGVTPSFDAYQAPTEHPLYVALCALVGLVGEDGDRLLVLLTALGHAVFTLGVFRLGRATFGTAAGIVAALAAGSSFALLLYAARAYVDVPFLALVIWAAALEAEGRRRWVPLLLATAGLLRPEAWVLAGLYVLLRPSAWTFAAAVLPPVLWALTDLAVTGDPLWSLHATSDLADELGRPRGLAESARSFVTFLSGTAREPVAALGVIGMVLAWRLPRARLLFGLFAAGCLTFAASGVAGLSVLPRYLTVPAVVLCVFAGHAAVRAWQWQRWVVVGVLVLAAPVVVVLGLDRLDRLRTELRFTADLHADLETVLGDPRVQAARRCGPVTLPNYRLVPDARWELRASRAQVGSRSARERDAGVALFLIGQKALRRYGFADGVSTLTVVPRPGFVPVARAGMLSAYAACPAPRPPGSFEVRPPRSVSGSAP